MSVGAVRSMPCQRLHSSTAAGNGPGDGDDVTRRAFKRATAAHEHGARRDSPRALPVGVAALGPPRCHEGRLCRQHPRQVPRSSQAAGLFGTELRMDHAWRELRFGDLQACTGGLHVKDAGRFTWRTTVTMCDIYPHIITPNSCITQLSSAPFALPSPSPPWAPCGWARGPRPSPETSQALSAPSNSPASLSAPGPRATPCASTRCSKEVNWQQSCTDINRRACRPRGCCTEWCCRG